MARPSKMKRNRAKPEKAPAGNWEAPEPPLLIALGTFIMAWSLIESTIEVAIAKQLGLAALEGSIVTASAQFRARASVLLSLLERDPKRNASGIRAVKDAMNITDRNDMLHSVIGGSKSLIWFNRRKTDNKFTSKIEKYDTKRLLNLALRCSDLAGDLMKHLKISKDDYLSFFQDSHNIANSV